LSKETELYSLTEQFRHHADTPDLSRSKAALKAQERIAYDLGMGDVETLESAGLMARNNAAHKTGSTLDEKRKDKRKFDQLLDILSQSLISLENELLDLENKIADARETISNNLTDIDYIRSLDADELYGPDGQLKEDVKTFLKKHGYDDLDDKTAEDICHMLTAIEVRALEDNDAKRDKIANWTDRHAALRAKAKDMVHDDMSDAHKQQAQHLSQRDPEQLARERLEALEKVDIEKSENLDTAELSASANNITANFEF